MDDWEIFANERMGVVIILPPFTGCGGSRLIGFTGSLEEARQYAREVAERKGYAISEPFSKGCDN